MNSLFVFPKVVSYLVYGDKKGQDTADCVWEKALEQAGETLSVGIDLVTQYPTVLPDSRIRFLV